MVVVATVTAAAAVDVALAVAVASSLCMKTKFVVDLFSDDARFSSVNFVVSCISE